MSAIRPWVGLGCRALFCNRRGNRTMRGSGDRRRARRAYVGLALVVLFLFAVAIADGAGVLLPPPTSGAEHAPTDR